MCSSLHRQVPLDKRKDLVSYSSLCVTHPVGPQAATQPEGKEKSGRGKSGFKQSFVLTPIWGLRFWVLFCEHLCGKHMVPVTSTNEKHRKKWKAVDVIISSAIKQPAPSHTCLAADFVNIQLSPAFKPLVISPWLLDCGPHSDTTKTI